MTDCGVTSLEADWQWGNNRIGANLWDFYSQIQALFQDSIKGTQTITSVKSLTFTMKFRSLLHRNEFLTTTEIITLGNILQLPLFLGPASFFDCVNKFLPIGCISLLTVHSGHCAGIKFLASFTLWRIYKHKVCQTRLIFPFRFPRLFFFFTVR